MFNFLRANDDDQVKSDSSSLNSTPSEPDSRKASEVIQILELESNDNSIIKPFDSNLKQLVCNETVLKPGFNSVLVAGEVCTVKTCFC